MTFKKLHTPSRLAWTFWPEKEFTDVYENIYVRAFTEDWFKIVLAVAGGLEGHSLLLDIGCGEGHTTKQILDRIHTPHTCDLLEPHKDALMSAQSFLQKENNVGDTHAVTFKDFEPRKTYDAVFTSHTNYYWSEDEKGYTVLLEKFLGLVHKGGKALMLTLLAESDQYKVLLKDLYKQFVRAEYFEDFCRARGYIVEVKNFSMRLYVGDLFTTRGLFDVKNFYRFLHNVQDEPSDELVRNFLEKIREIEKNGYLDFKGRLIIATNS